MASDSMSIRRTMNLMESANTETLLEGWIDSLQNKLNRRLGAKERKAMAQRFTDGWSEWLGHTDRDGTIQDMRLFMKLRIGITDEDIHEILQNWDDEPEAPAQENVPEEPKASEPKPYDANEGVPLPKDLDTKMSDYTRFGLEVSKDDGVQDADEVRDDPKRYMSGNEWDYKKIRAKLDRMKNGDKLVLGKSIFRRTAEPQQFYKESLDEAASDRLTSQEVASIMDFMAAHINEKYLKNGPKNDQQAIEAELAARGMGGRRSTGSVGRNQGGTRASGQYDTQEMLDVLKSVNYSKDRLPSLASKVKKTDSVSGMSDQDMDELALIGYAFLRART